MSELVANLGSISLGDQITLISSDKLEFTVSKMILATHSTVFRDMIDSSSDNSKIPVTETGAEVELFLEVIQGRGKEEYSLEDSMALAILADKYDSWAVGSFASGHLRAHLTKAQSIRIYSLAVKLADAKLANAAARVSLPIDLSNLDEISAKAFNELDIVSQKRLHLFHSEHSTILIKIFSLPRPSIDGYYFKDYKNDSPYCSVGHEILRSLENLRDSIIKKFVSSKDFDALLAAAELETLKKLSKCDYCAVIREKVIQFYLENWKKEVLKVSLPF